jgi:hypothetical protein
LEQRIDDDLAYLTREIRRLVPAEGLAAIVLGGGYGRGDGGVRIGDQGPAPYNDYDLFVVLKRGSPWRRRVLRRRVAGCRPRWEAALDLEVDVAVCTRAALGRKPLTLRLFDLAAGHRVLWGDEGIGELIAVGGAAGPPAIEGARLLVNRGSLQAFCKGRAARADQLPPNECGRLIRYLYKAILACGDAVLMHAGLYATDADVRIRRLRQVAAAYPPVPISCVPRAGGLPVTPAAGPPLEILAGLSAWYAYAVDSHRVGRETIPPGCAGVDAFFQRVWTIFEQVHRWFEGERLSVKPLRWTDYVRAKFEKFPPAGWQASVWDRAKQFARIRGRCRFADSLLYGRENMLAGWLAELLYLRGQPAVPLLLTSATDGRGSGCGVSSQNWDQQFRAYWTSWQESE